MASANFPSLAAHIGLLKVMRDYNLKRVISFHGRVQRAQEFADPRKCQVEITSINLSNNYLNT